MRFLYFLKHLIVDNPVKSMFWIVTLILLYFPVVMGLPDDTIKCSVRHTTTMDGKYVVLYQRDQKPELLLSVYNEDPHFKNNSFILYEVSGIFCLCVLFGSIGLVTCIIGLFVTDSEGWEIKKQWVEARVDCVECHLEDNVYYYIYRRRLVIESPHSVSSYDLSNIMSYNSNIKLFPKYETRKQSRTRKLSELEKASM